MSITSLWRARDRRTSGPVALRAFRRRLILAITRIAPIPNPGTTINPIQWLIESLNFFFVHPWHLSAFALPMLQCPFRSSEDASVPAAAGAS